MGFHTPDPLRHPHRHVLAHQPYESLPDAFLRFNSSNQPYIALRDLIVIAEHVLDWTSFLQ